MELKNRILEILNHKGYSYKDLAKHVDLGEKQLDEVLELKTLEVRTLEQISKVLQIPLYSFFRGATIDEEDFKEKYYNVNVWNSETEKYRIQVTELKAELNKLKAEIAEKDLLLEALEEQLKET